MWAMMIESRDWTIYRHWHELLDGLCVEQGYLDNMSLAEQLCTASGNKTQVAFETAVKNLRNWRHGAHIPQRRNFLLLGKLLKVDRHDGLRAHWNRLYGQAKIKPVEDDVPAEAATGTRKSHKAILAGAGIAAVMIAAAWGTYPFMDAGRITADPVGSFEGIVAEYVRNVSVKVGESAVIHGARGNECGPAPSWESARLLLPEIVTGRLTDGGIGTRQSRQCGGRVPARAILFTATNAGTEQISLYGDDIVIRVSE